VAAAAVAARAQRRVRRRAVTRSTIIRAAWRNRVSLSRGLCIVHVTHTCTRTGHQWVIRRGSVWLTSGRGMGIVWYTFLPTTQPG
jgi:hypothetical protein